jgi:hypothetical protein
MNTTYTIKKTGGTELISTVRSLHIGYFLLHTSHVLLYYIRVLFNRWHRVVLCTVKNLTSKLTCWIITFSSKHVFLSPFIPDDQICRCAWKLPDYSVGKAWFYLAIIIMLRTSTSLTLQTWKSKAKLVRKTNNALQYSHGFAKRISEIRNSSFNQSIGILRSQEAFISSVG